MPLNQNDLNDLHALINSAGVPAAWIGINDLGANEGNFVASWGGVTHTVTFFNWMAGEPRVPGYLDCVDVNQDGKICREEFIQGFPELDDSTVSELISEADADGDGNIDFDELWSVVQTVAAQEVTVLEGSRKLKLDSLPRSKAGQDVGSP